MSWRPGKEVLTDPYHPLHRLWDEHGQHSRKQPQKNNNNMGNYINKLPDGTKLGPEKSGDIAALCDEMLEGLPMLSLVPQGLVLIAVVQNEGWEGALIIDNEFDWTRVANSIAHGDSRPVKFFLVKREWVQQMADKPLLSDQNQGGANE